MQEELRVGKAAGKAILGDKIGDAAGYVGGGYVGSKIDPNHPEHKERNAIIGATLLGSGLMYASMRKDLLSKVANAINAKLPGVSGAMPTVPVPRPVIPTTNTIGVRG